MNTQNVTIGDPGIPGFLIRADASRPDDGGTGGKGGKKGAKNRPGGKGTKKK